MPQSPNDSIPSNAPISLAGLSDDELHDVLRGTLVSLQDAMDQATNARRAVRDALVALDEELRAAAGFRHKVQTIVALLRRQKEGGGS